MLEVLEDIGIYTNIHESENKTKDGHKLYFATCKECGTIVEKRLADLKKSNTLCRHKTGSTTKINDMPPGWMNQSKLNFRIYHMWKAMITRTTEKFWEKYPTYTGTTIDDSWRKLSVFVKDIQDLEGYNDWVNAQEYEMMIDKDTKIKGNKHYSKDTCVFITHSESNKDIRERHPENLEKAKKAYLEKNSIPVKFINRETKEEIIFPSIKEGCRELNLNLRNVWKVLNSNYPNTHVKNWEIYKISQENK